MTQKENIFDKLSDDWWKIDEACHYMHLILLELNLLKKL